MKTSVFYSKRTARPEDTLRKLLGVQGRRLGSGAYATAYWSPSRKKVIKIGRLDDPYLDYVRAIKRRKSSLFPKISDLLICLESGTDRDDNEGAYAVVMERLIRPSSRKQRARVNLAIAMFDTEGWDVEADELIVNVIHAGMSAAMFKQLKRAADFVKELVNEFDHCMDMHDENIMLRRNGQLVLTDPFCD